jgi:hypothetical protein
VDAISSFCTVNKKRLSDTCTEYEHFGTFGTIVRCTIKPRVEFPIFMPLCTLRYLRYLLFIFVPRALQNCSLIVEFIENVHHVTLTIRLSPEHTLIAFLQVGFVVFAIYEASKGFYIYPCTSNR